MRRIYYGNDHILSCADSNQPDLHKHWAKHIAVSLDNQIRVVVEKNIIDCDGIIINSDVMHTVSCMGQRHFVFTFEESSNIASEIGKSYLQKSKFSLIDLSTVKSIRQEFDLLNRADTTEDYYISYNNILESLGLKWNKRKNSDERIMQALDWIREKQEVDNNIIREILDLIDISQSRFSHLFKEQVGIPFNSYLVMMKLKKAYKYLFDGKNITNAALMAGFDSASHFAATSKSMIGLSAKSISDKCTFLEI